ncbi:hypothetical protein V2I01_37460 [Micromonospora sp. BRA006-A]|nr:hypothetical protein [Micromonospora sp. BRA006-A]
MRVVIAGGHGKIAKLLERELAGRGDTALGLIRSPTTPPRYAPPAPNRSCATWNTPTPAPSPPTWPAPTQSRCRRRRTRQRRRPQGHRRPRRRRAARRRRHPRRSTPLPAGLLHGRGRRTG